MEFWIRGSEPQKWLFLLFSAALLGSTGSHSLLSCSAFFRHRKVILEINLIILSHSINFPQCRLARNYVSVNTRTWNRHWCFTLLVIKFHNLSPSHLTFICSKSTIETLYVVPLFLLLTFNLFHTFF